MASHFPQGEQEYQLAEMLRAQIVEYIDETRTDAEWEVVEHQLDMCRSSVEAMLDRLHWQMELAFRIAERLGIIKQVTSHPSQIVLVTSDDHEQLAFEFAEHSGLVA